MFDDVQAGDQVETVGPAFQKLQNASKGDVGHDLSGERDLLGADVDSRDARVPALFEEVEQSAGAASQVHDRGVAVGRQPAAHEMLEGATPVLRRRRVECLPRVLELRGVLRIDPRPVVHG